MKKASKSKEKSTKSVSIFYRNKANLSEDKFGAKYFSTRIYERFHPLPKQKNEPNQTQFKPNTKPIVERPKMNLNVFHTKIYNDFHAYRGIKTNPIQSQFKPNWSEAQVLPALSLTKGAERLVLSYTEGVERSSNLPSMLLRKTLNLRIFELTKRVKKVIIKYSKTMFRGLKLTENHSVSNENLFNGCEENTYDEIIF